MIRSDDIYRKERSRNFEPTETVRPPNDDRPTTIEALRLMRDTTQSRDQYARAVAALKAMGVSDE